MEQRKETLVFVGEEEQKLRYAPSAGHGIRLRGPQSEPVDYAENEDFILDYSAGTIRRTSNSRIPDWRKHPLYGLDPFDHREASYYTNVHFTCELTYTALAGESAAVPQSGLETILPRLYKKLQQGESIRYVVYGDSISAGFEASRPENDYPERFAAAMRQRYAPAAVHVYRKALGGESSRGGLRRLHDDVLSLQPDLITIGYGMNDQNRQPDGSNAIPVAEFERNLEEMVGSIRAHGEAEIILITPCLPNPKWMFASRNVTDYAEAIRRVGTDTGVPVADVQRLWLAELEAGKTHESLLLNNLNHPNDYGHGLYAHALESLLT